MPAQRRHVLRHRVRAGVPRRHRRRERRPKSNKLGYVYAFPIPQTIANINAFQLGAQSVNPDAETYVVNTSNWCDPAKQAEAASSLIAQGVDVITQHQDCTATITKAAEEAGIMVVGYHADASELAPNGWVTGSEWDWGALYNDIVDTALAGEFTGSQYNANFRVGYKDGANPFVQSAVRLDGRRRDQGADRRAAGADLDDGLAVRRTGHGPGRHACCSRTARSPATTRSRRRNTAFVEGVIGDIPQG